MIARCRLCDRQIQDLADMQACVLYVVIDDKIVLSFEPTGYPTQIICPTCIETIVTDHAWQPHDVAGTEADADIREGRVKTFATPENLINSLKQPWSGETG